VRGFEVVAGVIAAFFVVGIVFGVLLVVALPAFHRRRDARGVGWEGEYRHRPDLPPGYGPVDTVEAVDTVGWEEQPGPHGDGPPPWPGRRG
jgi:hypothetical protein